MNRKQLHAKVKQICHEMSYKQGCITSIDVLLKLGYLSPEKVKEWRFGNISYLEKVCTVNLGSLAFINKTIRQIANELNLKPSITAYMQYGKGVKNRLVFSKSGDANIEKWYSTHFLNPNRIIEQKEQKQKKKQNDEPI